MLSDFEIRPATYLDKHTEPNRYEIVKWVKTETPFMAVDWHTGKKSMRDSYCYTIAFAEWNPKEPDWEFQSVGTRFLENYEEGLCEKILKWLQSHIPEDE